MLQEKEDVKTSDRRLTGSTYHTNLDEVLVGMIQGKRVGRTDKPLLKGLLINPPSFPKVYRWSNEPHVTEPQRTHLEWFTLSGQLE